MRLLKTDTIDLLPFYEPQPSKYAILSHTWGQDEVIYEDLISGNPERKPAYNKVKSACLRAAADGYSCIWIDNVCIDKTSSAELSEAINSMYVWYERADICYAYLEDVDASIDLDYGSIDFRNRLAKSKWFTRGWTLQELLAPCNMIFFAKDWTPIGTKLHLRSVLSSITGIDEEILENPRNLPYASIAKRMSWAADRQTTRPEDLAYCLMGVFSVNMPMLYGEGATKAYFRLQEEIMKQSDDQSLFAWVSEDIYDSNLHGLLADSPSAFKNSSKIIPYEDYAPRQPFQMTNRGLSIELPLSRLDDDTWVAALDCPVPPNYPDYSFLAVYLRKLSADSDQYARIRVGRLTQVNKLGARQTIYVRQLLHNPNDDLRLYPRHIFQIRSIPSVEEYRIILLIQSPEEMAREAPPRLTTSRFAPGPQEQRLLPDPSTFRIARGSRQLTAAIVLEHVPTCEHIVVLLGSSADFHVGYSAATLSDLSIDPTQVFDSLYEYFKAHGPTPLASTELRNHDVGVKMDSKISGANKYYMVDLETIAKVKTPKLIDLLVDSVLEEEDPGDQIKRAKKSIWGKISTKTKKV